MSRIAEGLQSLAVTLWVGALWSVGPSVCGSMEAGEFIREHVKLRKMSATRRSR